MFSKFVTALVASLSVVSSVLADGPDISGVTIRGFSNGGAGCPQGTIDFSISVNATSITATYSALSVALISGSYARKNCQINLDINYPSNLQYSILGTTFNDYANIDNGATVRHSSLYYFSGTTPQCTTEQNYAGPLRGDYTSSDPIPQDSQIWSPCGNPLPLNINNAVLLRSTGGADAYLRGKTVVTGIVWRNC